MVGPVRNFMRNAWEPIAVPRWAITLKYLAFVAVGITSFFSTVQTLDLATPAGYVPVWAGCLSAGAAIGAVGSMRPPWGALEAVGAAVVVAFLSVLTVLVFARGAIPIGLLLALTNILPAVRVLFLISRLALHWSRREEWRL